MLIVRNHLTINVPDNFLKEDYVFGRERVVRILQLSGLNHKEFADRYGFKTSVVDSWCTVRSRTEKPNNPNPDARVRLAFIECELQLLNAKKRA